MKRKPAISIFGLNGLAEKNALKWGGFRLSAVKTTAVEQWLAFLPLAPGTRAKIRNILAALFSNAVRYEWLTFNPVTKVRTSSARLRKPDFLTPDEFRALPVELPLRKRAMVMLAGSTGFVGRKCLPCVGPTCACTGNSW